MDGAADVLEGRVAQHPDDAESDIDLDVAEMRREAAFGARGVELLAGADRPAGGGGLSRDLAQAERLELAGIVAGRSCLAVLPHDRVRIDLPDLCGALAQDSDDMLRRLRDHHRRGVGDAAAAGQVAEADRTGVADQHRDLLVVDAQHLGRDVGGRRARTADVGMARDHHHGAVFVDVDLRARLAAGIEPEARGHAAAVDLAVLGLGQRRLVMRVLARRFDGLDEADAREDRAVRGLGSHPGGVLQPQLQRIHLQRFGDLIHHAFDAIGADRCARGAVGRDLRAVGDDVEAVGVDVRDVVGREGAPGGTTDRRTGKGAGLQAEGAAGGDQRAVLHGADLDLAVRARRRARGVEHLGTRHDHLDRAAGLLRQHQRQRLEIDDGLAAEAAADLGGNGADVVLRDARQIGAHRADHELALARTPDRGLAVGDADQTGVRLDVALVDGLGAEAALDDHVGLGEACVDVTQLVLEGSGDVGGLALELDEVVQDRRAGLHRLLDVDHEGQHLVFDLDQLAGFRRDLLGGGGDGGDRMAGKQRLLAGHDVAGHPAHVLDAQHHRLVEREVHDVLGGDDRLHAGIGFGLFGVD